MLNLSVFFLTLLYSISSFSLSLSSEKIHSVHFGTSKEDALIFYSNGSVAHVPAAKKHLLTSSISEKQKKFFTPNTHSFSRDQAPYSPSLLESALEAEKLFQGMRADFDEKSQCYNRSHVWAYEWRTEKNLFTSKAWLFFTPQYIRKYKFDWWFHVAPYVHIFSNNVVKERLMDKKYARSPLKLKDWTDIFIKDKSHCPVVNDYSEYADYPESSPCYVMKSSMYYYRPLDLEEKELTEKIKQRWVGSEVVEAYRDGFNIVY
jgi:hypothetical protein